MGRCVRWSHRINHYFTGRLTLIVCVFCHNFATNSVNQFVAFLSYILVLADDSLALGYLISHLDFMHPLFTAALI